MQNSELRTLIDQVLNGDKSPMNSLSHDVLRNYQHWCGTTKLEEVVKMSLFDNSHS